MTIGQIAAQLVHAAGETADPLPQSGTHAVVLAVRNEAELLRYGRKLAQRGIHHKLIYEPDPPLSQQYTAIGVYPVSDRTTLRKVLRRLPLLSNHAKGE